MDSSARFERQIRFAPLGADGQRRIERASVLVVGCGALGNALAQSLVRSGVGRLVLVDRDVVDASNLARQVLFEDRHARAATPKVDAARETLARIGGPTAIETVALHVDAATIGGLLAGIDLVLDGTDNLATRYLLNDACVERSIPWVYGGVVGARGLVLPVLPGEGPCLACLFPDPPPPGALPTCASAGVLQPAVAAVAALQAGSALRILAARAGFAPALLEVEVWDATARRIEVARDPACRVCVERRFEHLAATSASGTQALCGRHAVQVQAGARRPDLGVLAASLAGVARAIDRRGAILRFEVEEQRFTVFADGRTLIEGVDDEGRALALYDRYVGR